MERSHKAAAAVVLGVLLSTGCASTRMEAQWADPAFANQPLQGAKVLVVCAAKETVVRRVCQDEIAARIRAIGAQPLTASGADREAASAGAIDGDKALAAAREMDAKALFTATISRASSSVVGPSTTVGVGVGSGGWGGGTRVGGGVGISFPVGGSRVDDAYGANMVLTDVATGRIMWTIKVTAPASRDVGAQIRELARAGVESAQASGLF
jgi:hypothetical protein